MSSLQGTGTPAKTSAIDSAVPPRASGSASRDPTDSCASRCEPIGVAIALVARVDGAIGANPRARCDGRPRRSRRPGAHGARPAQVAAQTPDVVEEQRLLPAARRSGRPNGHSIRSSGRSDTARARRRSRPARAIAGRTRSQATASGHENRVEPVDHDDALSTSSRYSVSRRPSSAVSPRISTRAARSSSRTAGRSRAGPRHDQLIGRRRRSPAPGGGRRQARRRHAIDGDLHHAAIGQPQRQLARRERRDEAAADEHGQPIGESLDIAHLMRAEERRSGRGTGAVRSGRRTRTGRPDRAPRWARRAAAAAPAPPAPPPGPAAASCRRSRCRRRGGWRRSATRASARRPRRSPPSPRSAQ